MRDDINTVSIILLIWGIIIVGCMIEAYFSPVQDDDIEA